MRSHILHLDLDSFFVSVERLFNPGLNGKPVIVGGVGNRGVVSSCSYEARAKGVHSAMSITKAKMLCPEGIYLAGNMQAYSHYSKMVTEIIEQQVPAFEKASIDEFYVDLTGMDTHHDLFNWCVELRNKIIQKTALPISCGISVNKMLAKMATNEAKPNGIYMIPPGKEQEFLDPKPVGKIPFCGEKTVALLQQKGIQTIYDLRQFSAQALEHWLGKHGVDLWNRAHGIATAHLSVYQEPKSISSERTFDVDTDDVKWLKQVIHSLTDKLGLELRNDSLLTGCVTVKIRYYNFETHTKQGVLQPTYHSATLTNKAVSLFDEMIVPGQKVRLIGVRFSKLQQQTEQLNLFNNDEKNRALYKAIDTVKNKYGNRKITPAVALGLGNIKQNDPKADLNKQIK